MMLLALSSCAIIAGREIHRDREQMTRLQQQLKCGMSVKETESLIGKPLLTMPAPDPDATHVYREDFASLWLIYDRGGLRSSQVLVRDGLKATREEPRKEHCR
jgi:hypothetical protein